MNRRLIFIATVMLDLDEEDPDVQLFRQAFPNALSVGVHEELNARFLEVTNIDGANGGGGDGAGRSLDFYLSSSALTAQRYVSSPKPVGRKKQFGAWNAIKFPAALTAELCLVFESRSEYEAHMGVHKEFYQKYFAYATTLVETIYQPSLSAE